MTDVTETQKFMANLAMGIDKCLNADQKNKQTGFMLIVFPLNSQNAEANYVSNGHRDNMVAILEQVVMRLKSNAPQTETKH